MKYIILSFILLVPTLSFGMKKSALTVPTTQSPQQKQKAKKYNERGQKVKDLPFIGSALADYFHTKAATEYNSPTGAYYSAHLESNPKKQIALYEQVLQTDPTGDHLSRNLAAQEVIKLCNQVAQKYNKKGKTEKAELYRKKAENFTEAHYLLDLTLWESSLTKNDPIEVYRVAFQGNQLCNQLVTEYTKKGNTEKMELFRAWRQIFASKLNELNKTEKK